MILITGAAGKTGKAVISALARRGVDVRALVYRSEQVKIVTELGAKEIFIGDMRYQPDMVRAFSGVQAVYHIPPNVHPEEIKIGQNAIAAARSAGIEHFVFHSVLHPQTETMPHHWKKLRVEELLFESGLGVTILQPAPYMQNILASRSSILEEGLYVIPYPADTLLSMADLDDVAQAAAIILTEPGHVGATYEIVGTDAMSQIDVTETLSECIGRPIQVEEVPIAEWEMNAREAGLQDYQIETLIKMFLYYARYGLSGNPHVLSWILSGSPTNFIDFVKRIFCKSTGQDTHYFSQENYRL